MLGPRGSAATETRSPYVRSSTLTEPSLTPAQSLAFRAQTRTLFSGSLDRTLRLHSLAAGAMGFTEALFGHQDGVQALDALRAETAVSVGGRDRTARFWKVPDESQLVFRGGGRSKLRDLLEGGALEGLADGEGEAADGAPVTALAEKRKGKEDGKRFVEGSLECVAMLDETTFVSGGDSGCVHVFLRVFGEVLSVRAGPSHCGARRRRNPCSHSRSRTVCTRRSRRPRVLCARRARSSHSAHCATPTYSHLVRSPLRFCPSSPRPVFAL
jgi:hypothetical protein